MFKNSTNVIVATLAMSIFFAGCGNQNKKVKIPVRQVKIDSKGKKVACVDKKDPKCVNEVVTEQKTEEQRADAKSVENAMNDLKFKSENILKLGELPSGRYELVGLTTSFEISQGTDKDVEAVSIVSDFKVQSGASNAPELSAQPASVLKTGTSSQYRDVPAYINILTSFDLNVDDKGVAVTKEYFQSATLELSATINATTAASNDNVKAAHQNRESNFDFITTAGSDMSVTEFKSSTLSKDGKIVASAAKEGTDLVTILVTFKKDSKQGEALHSVYATYKVTKGKEAAANDSSTQTSEEKTDSQNSTDDSTSSDEDPLANGTYHTGA